MSINTLEDCGVKIIEVNHKEIPIQVEDTEKEIIKQVETENNVKNIYVMMNEAKNDQLISSIEDGGVKVIEEYSKNIDDKKTESIMNDTRK